MSPLQSVINREILFYIDIPIFAICSKIHLTWRSI